MPFTIDDLIQSSEAAEVREAKRRADIEATMAATKAVALVPEEYCDAAFEQVYERTFEQVCDNIVDREFEKAHDVVLIKGVER